MARNKCKSTNVGPKGMQYVYTWAPCTGLAPQGSKWPEISVNQQTLDPKVCNMCTLGAPGGTWTSWKVGKFEAGYLQSLPEPGKPKPEVDRSQQGLRECTQYDAVLALSSPLGPCWEP